MIRPSCLTRASFRVDDGPERPVMKSDRCTIDFYFILLYIYLYLVRTVTNLFRECFNNDSGLQDLIDLFLPEIPYVAPT